MIVYPSDSPQNDVNVSLEYFPDSKICPDCHFPSVWFNDGKCLDCEKSEGHFAQYFLEIISSQKQDNLRLNGEVGWIYHSNIWQNCIYLQLEENKWYWIEWKIQDNGAWDLERKEINLDFVNSWMNS
jgi:hypothetical protein